MTDKLSKEARYRAMSANRSVGTRPEILVRSTLHRLGFRFRLQNKKLPGTPDLTLRKYKAVVFINGCFWHQHQNCKTSHVPKSRNDFWLKKFDRNLLRDQKVLYQLKQLGWRVAVIWECGLEKKQREISLKRLTLWLRRGGEYLEIPVYDDYDQ